MEKPNEKYIFVHQWVENPGEEIKKAHIKKSDIEIPREIALKIIKPETGHLGKVEGNKINEKGVLKKILKVKLPEEKKGNFDQEEIRNALKLSKIIAAQIKAMKTRMQIEKEKRNARGYGN